MSDRDGDEAEVTQDVATRRVTEVVAPARHRVRRALKWILLGLTTLLACAFMAVWLVLGHLHWAVVQRNVAEAASDRLGVPVRYDTLSLAPAGGLLLENLHVGSPAPFDGTAPELLTIGRVELRWSLGGLLGDELRVDAVEVQDVALTLVVDEAGTSLDPILAKLPKTEDKPPEPLSKALAALGTAPAALLERLNVRGVKVTIVRREGGAPVERWTLEGLGLDGRARIGGASTAVDLGLRAGAEPLHLRLARTRTGGGEPSEALLDLTQGLIIEGSDTVRLSLDVALRNQTFDPRLPPMRSVAHLEAELRFDPQAARTSLALGPITLLDGALEAAGSAALVDGPAGTMRPEITSIRAKAALDRFASLLPEALGKLALEGAKANLEITEFTADPADPARARGRLSASLALPELTFTRQPDRVALKGLRADVTAVLDGERGGTFDLKMPLGSLEVARGDATAMTLQGARLAVTSHDLRMPVGGRTPVGHVHAEGKLGMVSVRTPGVAADISNAALELDAPVPGDRIAAKGKLPIELLRARVQGGPTASMHGLAITFDVGPLDSTFAAHAEGEPAKAEVGAELAKLHLDAGPDHTLIERAGLDLKVAMRSPTRFDGDLRLRAGLLDHVAAALSARLRDARLGVNLDGVQLDTARPLASLARLRVSGGVASLAGRLAGANVRADGIGVTAATRWTGHPPYQAELSMPIDRLAVSGPKGVVIVPATKGALDVETKDLVPDVGAPARTRAVVAGTLDLGPMRSRFSVDKGADTASWDLALDAAQLGPVGLILPRAVTDRYAVPWQRMTLALRSVGRASDLGRMSALAIDHTTTVGLGRFALKGDGVSASADRLDLSVRSKGGLKAHEADVSLAICDAELDGKRTPGKQVLDLHATVDLRRPLVAMTFKGRGAEGLEANLALSVEFDAASHTLKYATRGHLEKLGLARLFVPPAIAEQHAIAWEKLVLDLDGEGDIGGVIESFDSRTRPKLARDPVATLRGKQRFALTAKALAWRGPGGAKAEVPECALTLDVDARGDVRHGAVTVEIPAIKAEVGGHRYAIEGQTQRLDVQLSGAPEEAEAKASWSAKVARVKQDLVAHYVIGDLSASARLSADIDGILRIEDVRLANPAGGTQLQVKGGVDLTQRLTMLRRRTQGAGHASADHVLGRRSVSVEGVLQQRIESIGGPGFALRGRGKLTVPFSVESGDLSRFRIAAAPKAEDLAIELPASDLVVTAVNGSVPIVQEVLLDPKRGVVIVGGAELNAYSRTRFGDQHPFLGGAHFLSVGEVKLGGRAIGPIAGNARVDRNVFGVDQLEVALLGGKVSGQCLVDYREADTRVLFRGSVTGVRPPSKSPDDDARLDANAALTFVPARLALEGRAELLRISKQHLLDLLDAWDPFAENVAANRVRLGLKVGYPKQVRMRFRSGFATLGVELGGLGSAVRIDEIRGVALGPILKKYLGPLLEREAEK